jgi:hypothetical protein
LARPSAAIGSGASRASPGVVSANGAAIPPTNFIFALKLRNPALLEHFPQKSSTSNS